MDDQELTDLIEGRTRLACTRCGATTTVPTQLLQKIAGQPLLVHCPSCRNEFEVRVDPD
jgi:transcription elongation factor Elf1